jgi:uncharacterized protein (DUF58 family)
MLPAEVRKKVKLLELRTRKLVNNLFSGEYHTAFKGQGMTFSDFREYVPGDDVRTISWALTARAGKPYVKKFDEERELTVILAVDVSSSTDFGSGEILKGEAMTHLAALLAFSAVRNKDQIGLLLFSDVVEHFVPPKKGRGQVQRLLRDLYFFKPKSRRTGLASACTHLLAVQKKRAVIFLLSDFMDQNYDSALRALGRKHDVIAVVVTDPAETELPELGLIELMDPETGQVMVVDSSSKEFRSSLLRLNQAQNQERDKNLKRAQVDRVDISSGLGQSYVDPLIQFFAKRKRR